MEGIEEGSAVRRQVQSRHIEKHAAEAIARRVGVPVADAVIGSIREIGGTVILHLGSGGNAEAVASRLRTLGYRVERTGYAPYAPEHFGVQLRVGPGQPLHAGWCEGSRSQPTSVCLDLADYYANPRGLCAQCGRDMQILADGTLRRHRADVGLEIPNGEGLRALDRHRHG